MKLSHFKLFLFTILTLSFGACDWLDTNTDVSTNPSFYSLTFSANDTIPGLEDATFTLEWDDDLKDSIIVNLDSLPYQTDITHVIATFSFYSSSGAFLTLTDSAGTGLDTLDISAMSDTLNFNKVISITNTAADEVSKKTYKIKVNTHQVEPNQYQWYKINDEIYSHSGSAQKSIYFNDSLYLYVNSGINNYLYVSSNGVAWVQKSVKGLPLQAMVRNIYSFNNKLYLFQNENSLYTTSDGINWVKLDYSSQNYKLINYLFELNGQAWSIIQSKSDNSYKFAHSQDGSTWLTGSDVPSNFPIGDFAAISFKSRTNKAKAVIAGGYSAAGLLLQNVWSTENGSYWIDFSSENLTFGSLAGASIIHYDNKLLLFGGMTDEGDVSENNIMESIDEGYTWSIPDSASNYLHEMHVKKTEYSADSIVYDTTFTEYPNRSYQSVVYVKKEDKSGLFSNYYIYLIGGHDRTTVYRDVWKGQLNRLSFIRQDN